MMTMKWRCYEPLRLGAWRLWNWMYMVGWRLYTDVLLRRAMAKGGDTQIEWISYPYKLRTFRSATRETRWLLYSLIVGDDSAAREWLDCGADINTVVLDGKTPLLIAAESGLPVLETLILRGARLEDEHHGMTALAKAALYGHADSVKTLITYGARINGSGGNSLAPLVAAAQNGHVDIVEILLEAGADIEVISWGRRALMEAAEHNHAAVVGLLVSRGADRHAKDYNGKCAYDLAMENNNMDALRIIVGRDAK